MAAPLSGLDSLRCEFLVPDSNTPPELVSRWSDTNISLPRLVVTPTNQRDIQAAIGIAKTNGLTVVTGGGGHGTFVTIGSRTLYLDMRHFKAIQLDKERGTVRVGGGVLTGELLKALAVDSYYTPLPNSNAVGVVGCVLGGGSTTLNGLHGWMADIAVSFCLVAAEGNTIEVSSSSSGKDLTLFHALCGAGHGLGVITSMTTRAYPISGLNMTEGKIWSRTLIFPAPAIEMAAEIFLGLGRPLPAASTSISFLRSPPGTPAAGSPIIILGYLFYGPAEEAEAEAAALSNEDVARKALVAKTELIPFTNMNDKFEPQNIHGGHKAIASCRLERTDAKAIKSAFEKWASVTEKFPDAQRSPLVVSSFNSTRHTELGETDLGAAKFLESRSRDISAMFVAICEKENTMTVLTRCLDDTMAVFRESDAGVTPRSFPNNLRFGMDSEEMFDRKRLTELRHIKEAWDAEGIFWSPYNV
ncbi:hypothetical protein ACJ41O_005899 [Fusarium nematophilum]